MPFTKGDSDVKTTKAPPLRLKVPLAISSLIFGGVVLWVALFQSADDRVIMHFDGPNYSSVDDLATEAEAVVEVKVRRIVARTIDYGGEEPITVDPVDGEELSPPGVPLAIYEAQVFQSHGNSPNHPRSNEFRNGERILIAMLDDEKVASDSVVRLSQSERYLMFLSEVEDPSTLDVDLDGRALYITLNDSNGVLEYNGRSMQPNEWVSGVTDAEARAAAEELELDDDHDHGAIALDVAAVEAMLDSVRN